MFREHVADLAHRAVAIVGGHHHQHRRAAGTVALEHDLVDLAAFELARAAHDGALDVIGGHTDGLGGGDGRPQPGIHVRIAAAARRDHDFLDATGENFPAFGVKRGLLVLDGRPFECPDIQSSRARHHNPFGGSPTFKDIRSGRLDHPNPAPVANPLIGRYEGQVVAARGGYDDSVGRIIVESGPKLRARPPRFPA